MGDVHFAIRHGLTGFVFLVFAVFGLGTVENLLAILAKLASWSPGGEEGSAITVTVALVTAFLATPVVGVLIQGLHIAVIYGLGWAWADPARREVAARIRAEIGEHDLRGMSESTWKWYPKGLDSIRDDSLFVWLYHSQAPDHMIDWARRRRSYHYLGQNWVLAAVFGYGCGCLAPWVVEHRGELVPLLIGLSLVWAAGTLWVAREMKRDADDMEFIWALSRLYPEAFGPFLPRERRAQDAAQTPDASS